eukprot:1157757_1
MHQNTDAHKPNTDWVMITYGVVDYMNLFGNQKQCTMYATFCKFMAGCDESMMHLCLFVYYNPIKQNDHPNTFDWKLDITYVFDRNMEYRTVMIIGQYPNIRQDPRCNETLHCRIALEKWIILKKV